MEKSEKVINELIEALNDGIGKLSPKGSLVERIGEERYLAILRKTVHSLPDRPSDAGMTAAQIKAAFYRPITDEEGSLYAELNRIADELNLAGEEIEKALTKISEILAEIYNNSVDKESFKFAIGNCIDRATYETEINAIYETIDKQVAHKDGEGENLYASNGGKDKLVPISSDALPNTAVKRDGLGCVKVAEPMGDSDAVNKIYANRNFESKADSDEKHRIVQSRLANLEAAATDNIYVDRTAAGVGWVNGYADNVLPYAAVSKIGGRHTKGREKNLIPYPYNSGFADQMYFSSCTVMDNGSIVSSETYNGDIIWLVKSADRWNFGTGTFTLCAYDDLSRFTNQHSNLVKGGYEYGYKMVLALFKDGAWRRSVEVGVIDINSDRYTYRYSQTFTVESGEYDYATLCIYLYGSGQAIEMFPQLEPGAETSGYDVGILRISDPVGLVVCDFDNSFISEYKIPDKLLKELKSINYGYGLGDAEKYNYIDFINKQYVMWYTYEYTDGQITGARRRASAKIYDISAYLEDDIFFEIPNVYFSVDVQSDELGSKIPLEIKWQQKIVNEVGYD